MYKRVPKLAGGCVLVLCLGLIAVRLQMSAHASDEDEQHQLHADHVLGNAAKMIAEGRRTFRFDTFGDEVFWGDTL